MSSRSRRSRFRRLHFRRPRFLRPRGLQQLLITVHGLTGVDRTVQAIVELVVSRVGFQVAALSVARAGNQLEMVAVAGDEDARRQLLGTSKPRSVYEEEFAVAERWGGLLFVPHQRLPDAADRGWVPTASTRPRRRAWHPLDALYAPLRGPSGDLVGVLSVDLPVSGRRPRHRQRELLEILAMHAGIAIDNARLTEELLANQELFRVAFDRAGTGMAVISLDEADYDHILRVNPRFCAITGRSAAELLTMTSQELTHPDDQQRQLEDLRGLAEGTDSAFQSEKRYIRGDGSAVWVSVTVTRVRAADGSLVYAIGQVEDITARRALHQDLRHRAHHDSLTGLPNRAALLLRLGQAVSTAQERSRPGALFFLDLDGFKRVNDEHGHLVGDQVLALIGSRLSGGLRPGDMAGRWGGDEFLVIADDLDAAAAADLAARLDRIIAGQISVAGVEVSLTASIGFIPVPVTDSNPDELLAAADHAMYGVKHAPPERRPAPS